MAIGSDGNLYAWGNNTGGELGDGTTTNRNTPEKITLAAGITPTAISEGVDDSMAIGSDGNLYAWGLNTYGQLGDGSTGGRITPERITLASGVSPTVISAGWEDSLAIGSDGNMYAWGHNSYGELGDGSTAMHTTPEEISLGANVAPIAVSVGDYESLAIGSLTPGAQLPETPLTVALPLSAIGAIGVVTFGRAMRSRRKVRVPI
jgi:alpha-tubulin suppressor-like RCC1 family protein